MEKILHSTGQPRRSDENVDRVGQAFKMKSEYVICT
jgi:hypothetical protein